jgi:hypothetical protein
MNEKRLIKNLKSLEGLEPDKSWQKNSKVFLMVQVDKRLAKQTFAFSEDTATRKSFSRIFLRKPFWVPAMTVVAVVLLAVVSVKASQNSLPGESLYPVKTVFEDTQVFLSFSPARQAALEVSFIEKRVDELKQVVAQTNEAGAADPKKISQAAAIVKKQVSTTKDKLTKLSAKAPAESVSIVTALVEEQTAIFTIALAGVIEGSTENVPEVVAVAKEIEQLNLESLGTLLDQYYTGTTKLSHELLTSRLREKIVALETRAAFLLGVENTLAELDQAKKDLSVFDFRSTLRSITLAGTRLVELAQESDGQPEINAAVISAPQVEGVKTQTVKDVASQLAPQEPKIEATVTGGTSELGENPEEILYSIWDQ